MKNILLSLILIALFANIAKSQVQIQWQKCLGGTSQDIAYSIEQTTDGGYIVAGETLSNNGDVSGNHGGKDVWVAKINSQGNIQWQKCLGGTNDESAYSIIQTVDGGYIVAGLTASNNGDVSGNHGSSFNLNDIWVVKLNPEGILEWQKCLGGTGNDWAYSIIQTNDGGYAVTGSTNSVDGDVSGCHGSTDLWLVKINVQGNLQWQKCFGGSGGESAISVIITDDGGYALMGTTGSFDGDVTGYHGSGNAPDIWVVKIDQLGNIQWQKCLGGTNNDLPRSFIQTNDGGYAIIGSTESNDGDVFGNHGGDYDIWVVKIDQTGNLQWQRCIGGTSDDEGGSIIQSIEGSFVITGINVSTNGDITGHIGSSDLIVIKINSQGGIQWLKCLGGTYADFGYSIVKTTDCGYIAVGQTFSNDGDVIGNHGNDIWVVKLIEPNISGIMFLDENLNGIIDSSETVVAGHLVKIEPGPHYTYANNNGYYYFRAVTGNYTVSYVQQPYWYTTTSVYNISIDSIGHFIDTLDIGVYTRTNVNDVAVYITGSPTRVGFETHYWLTYKNWGTVNASGTVNFESDSLLTYLSSTETPASQTGNNLVFDYNSLGPGAQRTIRADFQVPGFQHFGDTLYSNVFITPLVSDTNIVNNYDTIVQVITGSFDPNDKLVSPTGCGQSCFVEHGQRLTYTIRFQNTGTDTAFTVLLRDTIDSDLDFGTFMLEAYSHPVELSIHNGNELQFRFDNILLPDSNENEPESHGFVRYSISPKPGLADGTTATNTSYIFFDYNPAIVTNTTLNTFVTNIPLAEPEMQRTNTGVLAFPNPSHEFIYINLPELTQKVQVYNTNGEMVKEIIPQRPVVEIPIQNLPKGVYAVRIYYSGKVVNTKFVKE